MNRHLQLIDLERFGHVIVRAHLHGLDSGFDRGVSGNENDRRLTMMLAHVAENIEAAHRFHANIGDDDVRLNRVELLDRLLRDVKGKNLVTFFPAKRDDHLHHRRLVINDYDLGHSQRGEYFTFEKKKEAAGKKLQDPAANHDPWHIAGELHNLVVNVGGSVERHSDHVS